MSVNMSLEEKVKRVKATPFKLPKDVTLQKTMTPDNLMSYVFRHALLGELGRLLIVPHTSQKTQFRVEVAGDPSDPMTKKRQMILEPITRELLEKLDTIIGQPPLSETPPPYEAPKENHLIKSQVIPCERCNKPAVMLIFAPNADTAAALEDCTRLMYPHIQKMNVSTWIMGEEHDVHINGVQDIEILLMKAHPERDAAERVLASVFDPGLDNLIAGHCQKRNKGKK